jgi:hypothetical protein
MPRPCKGALMAYEDLMTDILNPDPGPGPIRRSLLPGFLIQTSTPPDEAFNKRQGFILFSPLEHY